MFEDFTWRVSDSVKNQWGLLTGDEVTDLEKDQSVLNFSFTNLPQVDPVTMIDKKNLLFSKCTLRIVRIDTIWI